VAGARTSGRRRRAPVRAPLWWRITRVVLGVAVLAGVVLAGWLVLSGVQAHDELQQASDDTGRLRVAVAQGDQTKAAALLLDTQQHARRAADLTNGWAWRMVGSVPLLGRTPAAVSQTTLAIDAVAEGALPYLTSAVDQVDLKNVRHGNTIELGPIANAEPGLAAAASALGGPVSALQGIDLSLVPDLVADQVRDVTDQLVDLRSQLTTARDVSRLLPSMLGSQGTRRYLVVFQNEAEARGTGGLVGAYAVVQASHGRVLLDQLGSDADLRSASTPVVDLGPQYRALYGTDPALWNNVNLSAHFPYAARQMVELWRRQHGEALDGVVAIDPVLLGYVLGATGPAQLPDGTAVTSADVAALTMKDAYARYPLPQQNAQRKAFLLEVASTSLARLFSGAGDGRSLAAAVARGASEGRLLVWSAHPDEQTLLEGTAVAGAVDARPGPYALLAVDNLSGSKVDYYVSRSLQYQSGCAPGSADGTMASIITVTLSSSAPSSGLPEYAAYRLDRGPLATGAGRGGDGSVLDRVLVYVATGAHLVGATVDGQPLLPSIGVDGAAPGRPVLAFPIEVPAGQTRTIVLTVQEPTSSAEPRLVAIPGAQPGLATVGAAACR
jgi:hypothetical protein